MDAVKLYGPPGTGKTYRGMRWLEQQVEQGADVERVAFVSFTNAACDEARSRICARFSMSENELQYCATLHALAKRSLEINSRDWLADDHLAEFGKEFGYFIKPSKKAGPVDQGDLESIAAAQGEDAPLLNIWNFSRNRLLSDPIEGLRAYSHYDPDGALRISSSRFVAFVRDYTKWKRGKGFRDYTDLLVECVSAGSSIPVSIAIIDEAQDMTPLLWKVADVLFADADARATLGDDDQAIYSFGGAVPDLMNQREAQRIVKLRQSFRLPRTITELALSVISQNSNRTPKEILPTPSDGSVSRVRAIRDLPLTNGETWFILIRNWAFFKDVAFELERLGIPYRVQAGKKYSPWSERGPLQAARVLHQLGEGGKVHLGDLIPLLEKTTSQTKEKVGAWVYGAKTQIRTLAEKTPGGNVSILDLPALGLTQHGFDLICDGDLKILSGFVSDRDLSAFHAAKRQGHWEREPKVIISSIHGVKGAEADNVAAYQVCTNAPMRSLMHPVRREEEIRLGYVAITRAKQRFYGVQGNPSDGGFPYEVFGV